MSHRTQVPEALIKLANLYKERNELYGSDYLVHGNVMLVLFPGGIILRTPQDFNRYAIFKMIVAKIGRYANSWGKGGHEDSLNDISVYAQMLNELDQMERGGEHESATSNR